MSYRRIQLLILLCLAIFLSFVCFVIPGKDPESRKESWMSTFGDLRPYQVRHDTLTSSPVGAIREAGQQIVVILSEQKTYAYEDGLLLKEFLVSTGVATYPTVLGTYAIYIKLDSTRMTGPGYDLPNVPWTMYFYQGYGFHGTYWHNNFGTPMSHGCVNMRTEDADWLYHWAKVGTPVLVLP